MRAIRRMPITHWLFVAALFSTSISSRALAQPGAGPRDGALISRTAYAYPEPGTLTPEQARMVRSYYTPDEYERAMAAVRAAPFQLERIVYTSDGLKVVAYLYAPRATRGKRLPAIIFNRGSAQAPDQGFVFAPFFERLARAGYVVIAPQYRGSAGGEGRDEIGGADVHDVLNTVPVLRSLGFVDMDDVFMYGESRGGMMTLQALRDHAPVRAAAVFGAFVDLDAYLAATPQLDPHAFFPDWDTRHADIVTRRSAIRWVDSLTTPLLIMNGGADTQVSPTNALRLAERLGELKRPYELVIFGYDGHVLRQHQVERDRQAVAWFRRHAKAAPAP